MKNYVKFAALAVVLSASASASPFLAIGDGAELFATGTVGIRADDNIFLTNKATSDTIFEVTPGLSITFGKSADLRGTLSINDSFSSYADNSRLNTNLFGGDFQAAYEDGKSKLDFRVGYHESNQNSIDTVPAVGTAAASTIGTLVRRDQFTTGASGEISLSEILSLSAGVSFDHTNYKHKGYGDIDLLQIPVDAYYKWTPKTDFNFGLLYRSSQVQIGQDSNDQFYHVGVRGELSPKLSGSVKVGLIQRNISGGGSKSNPGLDSSLTYAYSSKTSVQLNASTDYSTNPTGPQQKNLTIGGSVNSSLTPEWSVSGGLSYKNIDYYTRSDDYWEGSIGAGYTVNHFVRVNAGYNYRNNKSQFTTSSFTNNVFSVSSIFRY